MRFSTLIFTLLFFLMAQLQLSANRSEWIEEIRDTETQFCKVAAQKGLKSAFLEFADDEAVLKRGEKLIKGKTAIAEFFETSEGHLQGKVELKWQPDFIDVSDDGTMGYTFGPYTFVQIDSDGIETSSEGVFHTVWKRQADGSWKYVWD